MPKEVCNASASSGLPHRVHRCALTAVFGQQRRGQVGALDFEALFAGGRAAGTEIVQDAAQKQGFAVIVGAGAEALVGGEQLAEQVAAHAVVEHRWRLGGLG